MGNSCLRIKKLTYKWDSFCTRTLHAGKFNVIVMVVLVVLLISNFLHRESPYPQMSFLENTIFMFWWADHVRMDFKGK